jgi:predicted GNAT superfamily acetyltransferase
MSDIQIRDLTSIEEFRQVIELEKAIWGYTDQGDLVTVPVFIFTVHRGATLVGAFTPDGRMVGFAYAVVGMKAAGRCCGRTWLACSRNFAAAWACGSSSRSAIGRSRQGYDLIEWTFDPLQAMNAHFNFAKLGGVVEEYAPDFYGESTSVLHHGTPTDRIVLSWKITTPHVVRRIEHASVRVAGQVTRSRRSADRQHHRDGRRVAEDEEDRSDDQGAPVVDRDSDRLHRDAAAIAGAGARLAHGRAPDVRGLSCEGLSRC